MKPQWKTTSFSSALHEALKRQGLERPIREQDIMLRWEEIVGTAIARQAQPSIIRGGVLWIAVADAVWRQELSLMRMGLVAKINAALGDEIVKEIRLR